MPNVIISADSTCDLSDEQKEQYDVHYFPFHIVFRGKDHLDNVDITPAELFEGFYEDKSLPTTGASSKEQYKQYFEDLTKDGAEVIHFSLGNALSAANENATMAAEEVDGVYVIDGKSLSSAIGLQVLAACRLRDEGKTGKQIAEEVESLHARTHASFVLDTMEFLAAGGRCPSIVAQIGKMVSFKPEILVDNASGAMKVGKLYRGKQKRVLEKYVNDTLAKYPDIIKDEIYITHSGVSKDVEDDVKRMLEEQGFKNIYTSTASCTISSHCGPGTLGILFLTESPSK